MNYLITQLLWELVVLVDVGLARLLVLSQALAVCLVDAHDRLIIRRGAVYPQRNRYLAHLDRAAAPSYASTVRSSGMSPPTRHTTPCSSKRAPAFSGPGTRPSFVLTQTCRPSGPLCGSPSRVSTASNAGVTPASKKEAYALRVTFSPSGLSKTAAQPLPTVGDQPARAAISRRADSPGNSFCVLTFGASLGVA